MVIKVLPYGTAKCVNEPSVSGQAKAIYNHFEATFREMRFLLAKAVASTLHVSIWAIEKQAEAHF